MAKVDFGSWTVPDQARSRIELVATRLPEDWKVRLETKPDDSRCMLLIIEVSPRVDYSSRFDLGRFDQVVEFMASLVKYSSRPPT